MAKKAMIVGVVTGALILGWAAGQESSAELKNLIQSLKSFSAAEHRQAADKLMAMGVRAAAAIPGLLEVLEMGTFHWDGPDEQGRMTGGSIPFAESAAAILANIGRPAVEPLVRFIKGDSAPTTANRTDGRAAAIRVLGRIRDERAVEAVLAALGDRAPSIRAAAAEALLAFPDPAILDRVAPWLGSLDADSRDIGAWILINKKDERVLPYIQKKTQSPYPDIRLDGVRDLEAFGGPEAARRLTDLLKDPHPDIRNAVAAALKRLESKDRQGEPG
jgi:HEAT repeat protein